MTVDATIVIALFAFLTAVTLVGSRIQSRGTSSRVVKALETRSEPYEVRVDRLTSLWVPGRNNTMTGPGTGVYRLDDTGDVHLEWTPKRGQPAQFHGAIPEGARPNSPQTRRRRRVMRIIRSVHVAILVCGFAIGAVVGGGDVGHRLVAGFVGLGIAMVAVLLVIHVALAVVSARRISARGRGDAKGQ